MGELVDELRLGQVAQPELAESFQAKPAAQPPFDQVAGGLGDQHLPAVRGGFHPGAPVDRRVVDIVAFVHMRFPRVQPHPHPQRGTRLPRLRLQPKLASAGRLDRRNRAGKDGEETVTLPTRGDHHPAVLLDHAGDKTVVLLESYLHRVRDRLPQPRGALDVGQQERDRPGRQRFRVYRRAREALAQQDRQVVGQQPFQLPGRGEGPVGHGVGRADAVDHRRQPRLLIGRGTLQIQQHRLARRRRQPVLILQPGDLHPRRDPAVALPVDAHKHLALLQVCPVHGPRRVRTGARLIPHRH